VGEVRPRRQRRSGAPIGPRNDKRLVVSESEYDDKINAPIGNKANALDQSFVLMDFVCSRAADRFRVGRLSIDRRRPLSLELSDEMIESAFGDGRAGSAPNLDITRIGQTHID
jgi:hypothetical protein